MLKSGYALPRLMDVRRTLLPASIVFVLIGAAPAMLGSTVVGEELVFPVQEGNELVVFPESFAAWEFSLAYLSTSDDYAAEIRLKLVWGSEGFRENVEESNLRRADQEMPPFEMPGNRAVRISLRIPVPGGKLETIERWSTLVVGEREHLSFPIERKKADYLSNLIEATPNWTPTVILEVQLKNGGTYHPSRLESESPIGVQVRPAGEAHVHVTVQVPDTVVVPPGLQLVYFEGEGEIVKWLSNGSSELGYLPAKTIPYRVEQSFDRLPFRNVVAGTMRPLPGGYPLVERLPVNVSTAVFERLDFEGNGYLLFLFVDETARIFVVHRALVDGKLARGLHVLHESGIELVDGLLLHFGTDGLLIGAKRLVQISRGGPTQFWKLGSLDSSGGAMPSPGTVGAWFSESIPRRLSAALSVDLDGEIPEAERLVGLVEEFGAESFAAVRAGMRIERVSAAIDLLNNIDDVWLAERFPGSQLAVLLKVLSDEHAILERLSQADSVVMRDDQEGTEAREAVLGYFERNEGVRRTTTRAHELISLSRGLLAAEQKRRFWARLQDILVPRDATLGEAVSLLSEGRDVFIDDGRTSRAIGYDEGRITLDLPGLMNGEPISGVARTSVRAVRIGLQGANLPPADYRQLAEIGSGSLEIDLRNSNIDRDGLSGLLRQPASRSLYFNFSETETGDLGIGHFNSTRQLDLNLSDTGGKFHDPFSGVKAEKVEILRLDLSGTTWTGSVRLGKFADLGLLEHLDLDLSRVVVMSRLPEESYRPLVAHPKLRVLALALPKFAGSSWLAGADDGAVIDLDLLSVRLDPGTNGDVVFSEMGSVSARHAALQLRNAVVGVAAIERLGKRLHAQELQVDLSGTRIPPHVVQDFVSTAGSFGRIELIAPDGNVIEGGPSR